MNCKILWIQRQLLFPSLSQKTLNGMKFWIKIINFKLIFSFGIYDKLCLIKKLCCKHLTLETMTNFLVKINGNICNCKFGTCLRNLKFTNFFLTKYACYIYKFKWMNFDFEYSILFIQNSPHQTNEKVAINHWYLYKLWF